VKSGRGPAAKGKSRAEKTAKKNAAIARYDTRARKFLAKKKSLAAKNGELKTSVCPEKWVPGARFQKRS
jgi:hypothetical protein